MIKNALYGFVLFSLMSTTAYADVADAVAGVAKQAIITAGEVAKDGKTSVDMNNVEMNTRTRMDESAALGNVGNNVSADDVTMNNVEMNAKTTMRRSLVVGNAGNNVGKH